VKREDGEITVSRTIQIPSASIALTGMLTVVDQTYRLIVKSLLQNGYKLTHQTRTATVPPGDVGDEVTVEERNYQKEIDRLVDESMELIDEITDLRQQVHRKDNEVVRLTRAKVALEEVIANVTG
jgi:uncharacterized protein YdcH (DUF465 family)